MYIYTYVCVYVYIHTYIYLRTLVDSEEMGQKAHSGVFETIFSDAGLQPSKIEINIVRPDPPAFIQEAPYILFVVNFPVRLHCVTLTVTT